MIKAFGALAAELLIKQLLQQVFLKLLILQQVLELLYLSLLQKLMI
jgi:hypothetical protein